MTLRTKLTATSIALAAACITVPASAHGFGQRYDLPIPLNYFILAAAATVLLSFIILGFFVRDTSHDLRYPRLNLFAIPILGSVLRHPTLLIAIRILAIAVFGLTLATAFLGVNRPVENFSVVFVWIIWWVGMGYISALFGNLWNLMNPWKIIFEWVEKLTSMSTAQGNNGLYSYPDRLGVWPGLILLFIFAWMENVYNDAALPSRLGILIMVYSTITWAGMITFGKHTWLRHGEAFSILFGLFARFSPSEIRVTERRACRDCCNCSVQSEDCVDCYECFERSEHSAQEFNLRPYAIGLTNKHNVTASMAIFVVLMLGTVTFDGVSETAPWMDIQTSIITIVKSLPWDPFDVVDSFGLLAVQIIFWAVYLIFSWFIGKLEGRRDIPFDIAKAFVFSLIPIALAYNLAHFVSLLAIQGQGLIPLASDPFGVGWDIFGTSDYRINLTIISATFVWWVSILSIVTGHVISVYIAHVVALRRMRNPSLAIKTQYPMLVLMLIYTATSLWIIAQPII